MPDLMTHFGAWDPAVPLYHGSLREIGKGTVLTPGSRDPDGSVHSGDYVYATTSPESARYFASQHDTSPQTDVPVYVHQVEPVGDIEPHSMPGEDERFAHGNYRAKALRVIDHYQAPGHYASLLAHFGAYSGKDLARMYQTGQHPEHMYHSTPARNRRSIAEHGLGVDYGDDEDPYFKGVYVTPTEPKHGGEDIWRVHTKGLHFKPDDWDNFSEFGGSYLSREDIPPHHLELWHQGGHEPHEGLLAHFGAAGFDWSGLTHGRYDVPTEAVHALRQHEHRNSGKYPNLVGEVAERGIEEPLEVSLHDGGRVVLRGGSHRVNIAHDRGDPTVPVQVVDMRGDFYRNASLLAHFGAYEGPPGEGFPNPYHGTARFGGRDEFSHSWFHGTRGVPEFGERKGDAVDRMTQRPEERAMSSGWPQPNKLLGVHFSPLREVAHKFVGSVSSQHGALVHARLHFANPAHYPTEDHLNLAVAQWADKHYPHWHDDKLNQNLSWQYSDNKGTRRNWHEEHLPGGRPTPHGLSDDELAERNWGEEDPAHARYFNRVAGHAQQVLQWHPHLPEIMHGFTSHLRDQGHRGITYGNNVEGPYDTDAGRGGQAAMKYIEKTRDWPMSSPKHISAIAQPEDIETTHVEHVAPWREQPQPHERSWEDISDRDEPDEMRDRVLAYHRMHGGAYPSEPKEASLAMPGEYRDDDTAPPEGEIHRGVSFETARYHPETHRILHDESIPAADRAAHLMAHLAPRLEKDKWGDGGVGRHWSTSERTAQGFATHYEHSAEHPWHEFHQDPSMTRVVFHAAPPKTSQMITSPRTKMRHDILPTTHGEREVPLRNRTPVSLTGISWSVNAKDAPWTRHDFPQPIRVKAKIIDMAGHGDDFTHATGYVGCDQGHTHWGPHGASFLLLRHRDPDDGQHRYLLQKRTSSGFTDHGGTWALPGGALQHEGEDSYAAARRESTEEMGALPRMRRHHTVHDDHGGWFADTHVADTDRKFQPRTEAKTGYEAEGHAWFTKGEVDGLKESGALHPGFAKTWDTVRRSRVDKEAAALYSQRVERIHPRDLLPYAQREAWRMQDPAGRRHISELAEGIRQKGYQPRLHGGMSGDTHSYPPSFPITLVHDDDQSWLWNGHHRTFALNEAGYDKPVPVLVKDFRTAKTAALKAIDYEGRTGDPSHITRSERGTIPTSAIADMIGVKGERPGGHRNRQGREWEDFKADIAANGIRNPIFITKDYGEEPKLSEGNHRRDAAVELGLPEVPVEIRYFGHAERQGLVHTAVQDAGVLNSVNPTGSVFVRYTPGHRATAPLGPNMATLAETQGVHPDTPLKVYRGAPPEQKSIVPGDFITDNPKLAADYAGSGKVLSLDTTHGDVLDDRTEPGGGEYIYRPRALRTGAINKYAGGEFVHTGVVTPGSLPPEQQSAFDVEDMREHRRQMLDVAKNPPPGTRVWRGEMRNVNEHPADAASTGMHWSVNPDSIIGFHKGGDDMRRVVWQGVVEDHEKQAFPRSHPMWRGKHESYGHEAEVRFRPGTHVKLEGAYTDDSGSPGYLVPHIPERTSPSWKWHPLDRHIEIRHAGHGAADYSDVGIEREAAWDSSGSDQTGVYVRFGHWPKDERSHSPAGGYKEFGVSAYDMDKHGNPAIDHGLDRGHLHDESCEPDCDIGKYEDPDNDPKEEMQGRVAKAERNRYYGNDKPSETAHLVRGEMAGIGYDGEPLLQHVRRVGDWIDHRHLFVPGAERHRLARGPYDEGYEPPKGLPRHREAAKVP